MLAQLDPAAWGLSSAGYALVGAGVVVVLAAALALAAPKGGRTHRWAGRLAVLGALVAAVGAAARPGVTAALTARPSAAAFDPGPPAVLAALGLYLLVSGVRALGRKRPGRDFAGPADWALALAALAAAAWLLGRGYASYFLPPVGRAPAMVAFGALGAALALLDLWDYYHATASEAGWVYRHVGRVLAGTAATATAASAVAVWPPAVPAVVPWLWAPLSGVAVVGVAFAWFGRRFEAGADPADLFASLRWGSDAD